MRSIPVAVVLALASTAARGQSAPPPKVPGGYTAERIVPENSVRFPMFACFDDAGRLFVTESSGLDLYAELSALTRKCRVSLLEDKDGDGRFETSTVFQDRLVMPMGAAWRGGKLYLPDGTDLVALEDTDGDNRADRRTVILSGFGHSDNGGLHGVTFGPDGWLYMTCGQPDGYKLRRADGSFVEARSGTLLRCRPDGSDVQALARGFENLVEVAFFGTGDVIGTVNWYQRPEGGIRDALVHLPHGGLFPYVPDIGTAYLVSGPVLPAVTKFPAVALSGLAMQQSTSLGARTVGNLYSAQHNARKVGRHVLGRVGATFKSEDFDFVTSDDPDFHPSDVLEDADGSLVVVDTGSWYIHHCPTGQIRNSPATGGVWRVRRTGGEPVNDPRGQNVMWESAAPGQLTALLGDPRPAVRERAQRALVARGTAAVPALARAMQAASKVAAAQSALWTLGQVPDESAAALVRSALGEGDPDLVAAAARALGARRDRPSAGALVEVIRSSAAPHARHAAAEALAYCGDQSNLPAVWAALAVPDVDRYLEHALVFAAHHLADVGALEAALKDPHPRVQAAALLLLDQPPRPAGTLAAAAAFDRLAADDEYLRQVALDRVKRHPEWAKEAVGVIRSAGPTSSPDDDGRARELILAFASDADVQRLAAERITDRSLPNGYRVPLVRTLAQSSLPQTPHTWADALGELIDDSDREVAGAALATAVALRPPQLEARFAAIAADERRPDAARLEALRAVLPRRPRLDPSEFALLASRLDPRASPLDRLNAVSLLAQAKLDEKQATEVIERAGGDAVVSPTALLPALLGVESESFRPALAKYVRDALGRGWEPTEEQLEPLLKRLPPGGEADALRSAVRQVAEKRRSKLADYEPLLAGGDAARGRSVFFGNKVACSTCHRVGSDGGKVGPDLTKVGAVRAGRDILESVVLPSSTIAQGFDHYVVQAKTGEVYAGIIPQPSADVLEIRDSGGNVTRLRKDQVARLKRQPVSLMPDGLPAALSRDEFRDLLAYLQGLR
jgi:putative heme-binding domain-containing protein